MLAAAERVLAEAYLGDDQYDLNEAVIRDLYVAMRSARPVGIRSGFPAVIYLTKQR